MEDKESGSLSQKSTLDLIMELYQGGVTGSLKLERAPLQKAVYFRDGQILFAASNDPKDQLASILVEEGKLGPDQMQVAQARVSAGNPLAKVLTELGYISQRELADAARIKVEKILTDLYTWKEGTYQFATKSLPKGAIDLDLSTPQLIYASIGRIQDREWILKELGSLDTVLAAGPTLDNFISDARADDQASEVLRHADGVKSVTQIGALSSLGEFEVCKILAAGLVAGALTKASDAADATAAAPDDAFSIPSEPPTFDPAPSSAELPLGGAETVGLSTNPPPSPASDDAFQAPTDDTVFKAPPQPTEPEQTEKTVFEAAPGIPSGLPTEPVPTSIPEAPPSMDFGAPNATASELLIDDPEPDAGDDSDISSTRMPPRPKGRRGGASSGNLMGLLKIAGAIVLAAAAAFSVYYFVWPMVAGGGEESDTPPTATASGTTTAPTPPPVSSSSPDGPDTNTPPVTTDPRASGASTGPRPAPAQPAPASTSTSTPATTSTTRRAGPTTAPPRPSPSPSGSTGGGGNGRQLLAGGDIPGAASAFLRELRSSGRNKFTVAVGLYCDEDNVGRVVSNARGSEQLYVLPTTIQGRECFRIVWGTFDTRQAAEQGMGTVPSGIRAGDAAAVPVASVLR